MGRIYIDYQRQCGGMALSNDLKPVSQVIAKPDFIRRLLCRFYKSTLGTENKSFRKYLMKPVSKEKETLLYGKYSGNKESD